MYQKGNCKRSLKSSNFKIVIDGAYVSVAIGWVETVEYRESYTYELYYL